jgi:glyoxylase-like metal-dependent hydrolase (beta-lactamase superfamily II)
MNLSQKLLPVLLIILLSSCSNTKKNLPKPHIKLYALECGDVMVKNAALFSPGIDQDVEKHLTVSCYLIKHPNGIILFDTGLNDAIGKKAIKIYDGNFTLKVLNPLMAQLKDIGVTPESVNYLVLSHFHLDHTGNANNFTNATLLVQKKEYDAAFGKYANKYGYNLLSYEKLKNNKVIKLRGDYDVFKDGSVIIKSTPGHTIGHQSLFVDLIKTGPVVLSGDVYHFAKNRENRLVPIFSYDKKQTLKSMEKLDKFVADNKATLWIGHDYEQNQTIKHSPKFYE